MMDTFDGMRPPITTADITRALDLLGNSSKTIAQTLANKGVTGKLSCPHECVIANYLEQQLGVPVSVGMRVDIKGNSTLYTMIVNVPGLSTAFVNDPMVSFIRKFDEQEYLELVEPSEPYNE